MPQTTEPPHHNARGPIFPAATVMFVVADVEPPDDRALTAGGMAAQIDAVVSTHRGQGPQWGSGDHVVAVFESATAAAAAVLDLRATIEDRSHPEASGRGVRIALHTGEVRVRDDGRYMGPAVRAAEHLSAVANPGQTLVSGAVASDIGDPPAGSSLVDLGVHRLRDLSSPLRVFELLPPEPGTGRLPLRSLDRVPNSLPVHLTGFVGRRAELEAVGTLLRRHRVVTLTGAGGAGKTRLAAQVAANHAHRWPDGVWWVELGSVVDTDDVADEVAGTIGVLVEPVRGPLWSLAVHLRDRRMLICLDNCEQVSEGAAEVAEALVLSCPEATVLATSREPLGVPGEVVWQVPPLAEDDAVALFVERASLVRPGFTLDASGDAAVRGMCARLDGMPLALELAAAWLRTLTPQQIAAGLDDRFALLVRGSRAAPPRQRTLAASIDWSHALLDEPDRIVFRRLAVFAGGFGVDAARAVCAAGKIDHDDVLHLLARLIDKSLVVAEERAGQARYRLLETIRLYAADRLDEAGEFAATRDRHLDHFLALAEAVEPQWQHDMDAWRTRLDLEHDNLRAALDWGLTETDPQRGRRLAAALSWLWHVHRHGHEGIDYLTRAIRRDPDDRSRLQAQLLTGLALVADTAQPLDLEFDAAQRALEIATAAGDDRLRALCLALSAVGQFYTDFDAAWTLTVEALAAAGATGDAFVIGAAHALQGTSCICATATRRPSRCCSRPSMGCYGATLGSPRPP